MKTLNLFVDTQKVNNMTRGYWLINSYRSEIGRFTENRSNEDKFNRYFFIIEKLFVRQAKNCRYFKMEKNLK